MVNYPVKPMGTGGKMTELAASAHGSSDAMMRA
jgi:hypothetical protein